jgi:hypothetical protein
VSEPPVVTHKLGIKPLATEREVSVRNAGELVDKT